MPKSKAEAPPPVARVWEFFETYTRDLRADDFQRLFTRETPEAWQFFAKAIKADELADLPWHIRAAEYTRRAFLAFTLRLSPARRAIYGIALVMALIGLFKLFAGIVILRIPIIPMVLSMPVPGLGWRDGTMWLAGGFLVLNLLILLEVADRLTLKKDLEVAREIQQAMLPREIYAATGIEAFGVTRPANTVGGDLYDVMLRPDGRIVFALGDVAGKGMGAALLCAKLQATLRALAPQAPSLESLGAALNGVLERSGLDNRYATLFYAEIEAGSGELRYLNAGHNPALHVKDGGIDTLSASSLPLGMLPGTAYGQGAAILAPGDVVVLYSDGITEATDARGLEFGLERLQACVRDAAGLPPGDIVRRVLDDVSLFLDHEKPHDDQSLLVLRRTA